MAKLTKNDTKLLLGLGEEVYKTYRKSYDGDVFEGYICWYRFGNEHYEEEFIEDNYTVCHSDFPIMGKNTSYLLNISVHTDNVLEELGKELTHAYFDYLYDKDTSPWRNVLKNCIVLEQDGLKYGALWTDVSKESYSILHNFCMATRLLTEHSKELMDRCFAQAYELGGMPFALYYSLSPTVLGILIHSAFSQYPTCDLNAFPTGLLSGNAENVKVHHRGKDLRSNFILKGPVTTTNLERASSVKEAYEVFQEMKEIYK